MKLSGISLILLLSLLAGCQSSTPTTKEDAHADEHGHEDEHALDESIHLSDEQSATAGIELFTVRIQPMQAAMTFPGTVTSTTKGRAVVTPPVAGRLIRLNIQPGDSVTQGQVIGVIESTELAGAWTAVTSALQLQDAAQARVNEAQAEINLATATLQSAEMTLTRQKQLAEAGAFNEAPLQAARSELNEAESDLLTIQKELITHTEQLQRMESLFADGLVSKVDVENARLDVQQDEVQVVRAEARLEIAKAAYAREKRIADQGLLNSREIQTAEADVRAARLKREQELITKKSAESSLANAKKAVAHARSTYQTYTGGASATGGRVNLTAPISGTITHLNATQGQAIDRTQPVCEIENLDSVWVTAKVPERDAGKIKTGTPVTLTVASQPSVELTGVVQVLGAKLDPETRTLPVQCLVTGANGRLTPEMFAEVTIPVGQTTENLVVPDSALIKEAGHTIVFVKEGDEYIEHEVEVGASVGGLTPILSGLEAGQQVVTEGAFILKSEKVKGELKGHEH